MPFGNAVTAFALDQAGNVFALTTNQDLDQNSPQGGGFTLFESGVMSLAQLDAGRILYVRNDGTRWIWNGVVKIAA